LPQPAAQPTERSETARVVRDGDQFVSYSGSQTPPELRVVHLAEITRIKGGDERADYASQFDHWHQIDLDGDGQDERLVFFTIEGFGGGNNYARFLAVYRYIEPVWIVATVDGVGGRGSASVLGDTVRLTGSTLSVNARFYDDEDGMCCPTLDGQLEFRVLTGGRLEAVTPE